jgi:hypothetical protein
VAGDTVWHNIVPAGRKKMQLRWTQEMQVFLILILWLASEALLKSTDKRLLQERTTSIAAQRHFACNSTGCCDSHPGKKIFSEDLYFRKCNAVANG